MKLLLIALRRLIQTAPVAMRCVPFLRYVVGTLLVTLAMESAWARPEYALQTGVNRCTACHISATGGGVRNLTGKYFGSRGYKVNPALMQEWIGADVKMMHYAPEKGKETRGGSALMAASVYLTAPLTAEDEGAFERRVVYEQNVGSMGASTRQIYMAWTDRDAEVNSWLPQQVILGRIIPAYGILSDEHRVFVRMQTATEWNTRTRMGVQFSANPYESLHYDFSILNGQENTGTVSAGQSEIFGGELNLRYLTPNHPWMLGLSANSYAGTAGDQPRSAQGVYAGLSVSRLTGQRVPVEVMLEYDQAKNWNVASWMAPFVTDAYATLVTGKESRGGYLQAQWELSQRWSLLYRYDYLLMDKDFPGDAFTRNGLGVKTYLAPNTWVMARYDKATAGRADEEASTRTGSLDAWWALLTISL